MYCFGVHTSITGGLHNALLEGVELKCNCVQLFVANQRQWRHPPLAPQQIDLFKEHRVSTGLSPLTAHSSYLINLASPAAETHKKSITALADELTRCDQLGIEYLVMHPGAHLNEGEAAGIQKVARSLDEVLETVQPALTRILLETTAGQGTCLGHRFEHLAEIISLVKQTDHLGICLDTCHIFAGGYDFRTQQGCLDTIMEFDRIIGLERLKVIHINDSKTDLGKRVDRHEHIGKGTITAEGLANILRHPKLKKLPFILETPKETMPDGMDSDIMNLAALHRLTE